MRLRNMTSHQRVSRLALPAIALVLASPVSAQNYPNHPLKLILPFPAGGPTDIVARALGQGLGEAMGQNVIIDNRPGGGGVIGAVMASKAPADGYTLLLGGITTFGVAPSLRKDPPYDALRDFAPVTQATRQPIMLMTHPSLPTKTLKDFIALALAKPGQINYASSGPGGSGHMAGELFRMLDEHSTRARPVQGAPPALNDLIAGQVQVMFGTILASAPHIRSGRVRALAITGPQRTNALPEVVTFAEAGLPAYDRVHGMEYRSCSDAAHDRRPFKHGARAHPQIAVGAGAIHPGWRSGGTNDARRVRRVHTGRDRQVGEGRQGGKHPH